MTIRLLLKIKKQKETEKMLTICWRPCGGCWKFKQKEHAKDVDYYWYDTINVLCLDFTCHRHYMVVYFSFRIWKLGTFSLSFSSIPPTHYCMHCSKKQIMWPLIGPHYRRQLLVLFWAAWTQEKWPRLKMQEKSQYNFKNLTFLPQKTNFL